MVSRGEFTLENLAQQITGGAKGIAGATLEDVCERLGSIENTLSQVESNTAP
jgi:hypothetical protein